MTSLEQHLTAHWLRNSTSYGPDGGNLADEDDLATICQCGHRIAETMSVDVESLHAAHVADTWREARTVRTVEELDALPEDAVIQYGPIILQKLHGHPTYGDGWFKPGERMPWLMPIRDSDIDGPIIILRKPEGWGWGRESQDGAQ